MTKAKKRMTAVCQVLISLLTIAVLICGVTKFSLLNKQRYYDAILTKEFDAVVLKTAEDSLKINQSIIAFPSEVLFAGLNKDVFLEDCRNFTRSSINALLTGDPVQTYSSEHSEFYGTVDALFKAYEAENGKLTTEEDRLAVTELLGGNINAQVNYLPVMVTGAISKIGASAAHYGGILSDLFWPALVLFLVFTTALAVLNKDNLARAVYKFAVSGWMACSVLFIPTLIFCSYNVAERLPLKTSGMAFFVENLVKAVQSAVFTWTFLPFLLFSAVLITGIVTYALAKHRRHMQVKKY